MNGPTPKRFTGNWVRVATMVIFPVGAGAVTDTCTEADTAEGCPGGCVEKVSVAAPWFKPVTKMNSARPPTVVAVLVEVCWPLTTPKAPPRLLGLTEALTKVPSAMGVLFEVVTLTLTAKVPPAGTEEPCALALILALEIGPNELSLPLPRLLRRPS